MMGVRRKRRWAEKREKVVAPFGGRERERE